LGPDYTDPDVGFGDSLEDAVGMTTSGSILAIDDDASTLGLLSELLELSGFEVLSASEGREGVDVFQRERALTLLSPTSGCPKWTGSRSSLESGTSMTPFL